MPIKNLFKIDENDMKSAVNLLIYVFFYGILLNFAFFCLLGLKFNWYSWGGYGIALWMIETKLVKILRSMWFR
jgi:hypothetical protein